jgi:hypothetical protein
MRFGITERLVKPSDVDGVMDSLSGKRVFSLKDFVHELPDSATEYDTVDKWTIPANHDSYGVKNFKGLYSTNPENFLIWTSRTIDAYGDLGVEHFVQTETETAIATKAAAAAATAAKSLPVVVEVQAQKAISPISSSPDFKKICNFRVSGHALRPHSLDAAFSTAVGGSRSPVGTVQRIGKPRKPQAFNSNHNLYL